MNYYVTYDPATGLVTGWFQSNSTPIGVSYIIVTGNQIGQLAVSAPPMSWTVQNGVLMAPTAASELLAAQKLQINILGSACSQAIYGGFTSTVNGASAQITLRQDNLGHDQTNALMASIAAQGAMQQALTWSASASASARTVMTDGVGGHYITFNGGVTGTTAPVWPTTYSTPVQDGTVTWYRMGFRVSTTTGTVIVDPPDAVALFGQGVEFINDMRAKYEAYKAQVMAATSVSAVQAVNWV